MPKSHELNIEAVQPDEILLADDDDLVAFEAEQNFLNENRGSLVPFGWDCV